MISPSPDSSSYQTLIDALNALRTDFENYKKQQDEIIHNLKTIVGDYFEENTEEVQFVHYSIVCVYNYYCNWLNQLQ